MSKSILSEIVSRTYLLRDQITIIIVANLKANVNIQDQQKYSISTEFFADYEYEQIITACRDNGFHTIFHKDEMTFLKWYFSGEFDKLRNKYKVVYGAASAGKGPGRKALIPAFCNLKNIPFTSSNAYVVSLCRHKYHFTNILEMHGIPTIKSWLYTKEGGWLNNSRPLKGDLILIKPTYEAASIGVDEQSVFEYHPSKDVIIRSMAFNYNQPITVQQFISGYEIEVPIIVNNEIPICIYPIGISINGEKELNQKILTYDIVYNDNYNFYKFDLLGEKFNEKLLYYSSQVAQIIGIEGFGRVDYRVTTSGEIFAMDVSTYPHIMKHSSFWYLLKDLNFEYKDLINILIGLCIERYNWNV